MCRYYFNIADDRHCVTDPEGTELPDEESARSEALDHARHLLSHSAALGKCRRHWRLEVSDEAGHTIFSIPFADALEPARL